MCFFIFRSIIFDIFSLTHKEEEVWPYGTNPMLFAEQVVSASQSFRTIAPFIFFWKKNFLGVWPYRYTFDVRLVTLILNIYGFVGVAQLLFQEKIPFVTFLTI